MITNLIMVFICVMLWNNYIVSAEEIIDDGSACRRVAKVLWETPEESTKKKGGRQSFDARRSTVK